MSKSKDLFDDTAMSFGEHLEALRHHLILALIGLGISVILCLAVGKSIVAVIRKPIDVALKQYGMDESEESTVLDRFSFQDYLDYFWGEKKPPEKRPQKKPPADKTPNDNITIEVNELRKAVGLPPAKSESKEPEADQDSASTKAEYVTIDVYSEQIAKLTRKAEDLTDRILTPITHTVEEAFMIYLKVSFVTGFVLASPWVIYQLWLFVAAGLYPHERKYVYKYLPISVFLFLFGVLFCFFIVFPFVLDFLLSFNRMLGVTPQIRLTYWISFAITLPVMFGLSFQLPIVMLFLEKINLFTADHYREQRRIAILVIAVVSMLMTPSDPASMVLMMIPLLALYELGIWMCDSSGAETGFETA